MKKTPLWSIALASIALAFGGLGIATPATAATITLPCDQNSVRTLPAGDVISFTTTGCTDLNISSVGGAANVTVTDQSGNALAPGNISLTGITAVVVSRIVVSATFTFTASGASKGQVTLSPGPATSSDSDTTAHTPIEVSLSLDLAASGASCKEGSAATGVMGAWMYLPAADDCSSTTNPDAKLLGWSTSANFPVERAQSQVDNRWGAIDEVFDGVRKIFIPAGQATFVSGPNSLHPIWAS